MAEVRGGKPITQLVSFASNFLRRVRHGYRDESGATAVEYAIMVALIAAVIIAVVILLGQRVNDVFENLVKIFP